MGEKVADNAGQNATIVPLVPESTELGFIDRVLEGQLVFRTAATTVTGGKVWVNSVITAAVVPMTETATRARMSFLVM